jgi:hypothetical protein
MAQPPESPHTIDPQHISSRLNRALQPQGIKAAVIDRANCLQITLASLDVPDREPTAQQVLQILRAMQLSERSVTITSYRSGDAAPSWAYEVAPYRKTSITTPPSGNPRAAAAAINRALQSPSLPTPSVSIPSVPTPSVPTPSTPQRPTLPNTPSPQTAPSAATIPQPIQRPRFQATPIAPTVIEPEPAPIAPTRPLGIKLIVGLFLIVGGINLAIALGVIAILVSFALGANNRPNVSIMFPYLASILLTAIAIAAGTGIIAIGLWRQRRWGLLLSYILAGLMIVRGGELLTNIWHTNTLLIPIEIGILIMIAVILFYLTRSRVTRQFR